MDFEHSPRTQEFLERLTDFQEREISRARRPTTGVCSE